MAGKKTSRSRTALKAKPHKGAAGEVYSYIKSLAIAFLMVLPIKHFVIEGYRVPTGSMENTILVGDFLLANKFIYGSRVPLLGLHIPGIRDPRQGDIVIFKFPENPDLNYIKRCIAGPGQVVEVRDKIVYVDGVIYDDAGFIKHTDKRILPPESSRALRDNYGPVRVPSDHFFMMGDNRDNSFDSRFWGYVPRENILGKALFLYLSWGNDPNAPDISLSRPLSLIESAAYNFINFYERMRWERLGNPIT
jgi:signal peptidase I